MCQVLESEFSHTVMHGHNDNIDSKSNELTGVFELSYRHIITADQ